MPPISYSKQLRSFSRETDNKMNQMPPSNVQLLIHPWEGIMNAALDVQPRIERKRLLQCNSGL